MQIETAVLIFKMTCDVRPGYYSLL